MPDLTGKTFTRLTVIERHKDDAAKWHCKCSCGTPRIVLAKSLMRGNTRSCGCLQKDKARRRLLKHGESGGRSKKTLTPEYRIWRAMITRCYDPNVPNYPNYGGRGIHVCSHWKEDFSAFLADVGRRPTPQHTLDRINNDGNYEPDNCRWATRREQSDNRRRTIKVTLAGITMPLTRACEIYGVKYDTAHHRLSIGFTAEKALGLN